MGGSANTVVYALVHTLMDCPTFSRMCRVARSAPVPKVVNLDKRGSAGQSTHSSQFGGALDASWWDHLHAIRIVAYYSEDLETGFILTLTHFMVRCV